MVLFGEISMDFIQKRWNKNVQNRLKKPQVILRFFYSIVLAGILCDSECVQHHTTVQLLPPGSQCDASLLTGCNVRFVTGAAQFWTALLGTQVEYAVAEEHTCIFRNSPIASGNFLETYFS